MGLPEPVLCCSQNCKAQFTQSSPTQQPLEPAQTQKNPCGVTVDEDETRSWEMGMFTAYLGSDGNYYVKVTAAPCEYSCQYSDGSTVVEGAEVYFKVEPIVWRVLTENHNSTGKALLLAILVDRKMLGSVCHDGCLYRLLCGTCHGIMGGSPPIFLL